MKNQKRKIPARRYRYLILFFISAPGGLLGFSHSQIQATPISLTIIYDYDSSLQGLKSGPGFSCFIQGTEKAILFNTGGKDVEGLFHNFSALNIDPMSVDIIVVSQAQPDEISGLLAFLAKKGECLVFLPASSSPELVSQIEAAKGRVVRVTNAVSVCEGVFSTGQFGAEQALVVDTPLGLVILTGCTKAGMIDVVARARSVMPKDVHLLLGGFLLEEQGEASLSPIVRRLREQGVKNLAATHCTQDRAFDLLQKGFGKNFVPLGAGKTIILR